MKHPAKLWFVVCVALSMNGQQVTSPVGTSASSSQAMGSMITSLQKMGALSSIRDVSADVTITSADSSQPVVTARFRLLGSDQLRSEDSNGNPFLIANNDVVSIDGEPKRFSLSSFSPGLGVFPWLAIVADLSRGEIQPAPDSESSETSLLVTRPTLDGIPNSTVRYKVYVNSTTGLIQRITFDKAAPTNLRDTVPTEIDFSDYRQVMGVSVPFQMVEKIHGHVASTTQVNSFTFNQGQSPHSFTLLPLGAQQ